MAATVAFATGWTVAVVAAGRADSETVTALATSAGIIASVLLHEGTHALAARSLGYRVEWVQLGLVAGSTSYSGRDDRPLDRSAIAMAGPAASAAAVLVLLAAWWPGAADPNEAVFALLSFNALTAVVNLLPLPGSDGWQVAAGLIEHRSSRVGGVPPPQDPSLVTSEPSGQS